MKGDYYGHTVHVLNGKRAIHNAYSKLNAKHVAMSRIKSVTLMPYNFVQISERLDISYRTNYHDRPGAAVAMILSIGTEEV